MSQVTLEFSPEMEEALKLSGMNLPDDSSRRSINFDDSGTLHVVSYDKEGKKLNDSSLERRDKEIDIESEKTSLMKDYERTKNVNHVSNIIFIIGIIVLFLGTISALGVLFWFSRLG